MNEDMIQAVKGYMARGWVVHPLSKPDDKGTSPGKKPLLPGWQNLTETPQDIGAYIKQGCNLGLVCGKVSNVTVLDFDHFLFFEEIFRGFELETLRSKRTEGRGHVYFKYNPNLPASKHPYLGVEVLSDGNNAVLPPSVHASGDVYKWSSTDAPGIEMPTTLEACLQTHFQTETELKQLIAKCRTCFKSILKDQKAMHGADGREYMVAVCTDLKAAGATEKHVMMFARLMYGKDYDEARTLQEWRNIDSTKTWTCAKLKEKVPAFLDPEQCERCRIRREDFKEDNKKRTLIEDINNTDVGNGRRLVKYHGQKIRYCHPWKSWLVWNGQRWKRDDVAEIIRMAKDTARSIYDEGVSCIDYEQKKTLLKHAIQSETSGRISAMVEMASSESSVPVLPDQLDKDGWLFNVQNGTIDLKTGNIRPQLQTDLITKISPVVYDFKAECPQWRAFLNSVFEDDKELIAYLQKYTGYCLTGDTSEEIILLGYGTGQNGKSKFREALAYIMGDYATSIPMESLLDKKGGSAASNDIAKLKGARFVHTSEQEKGRRLAESKLKDMTGRDTITARYLYQEYFDFKPEFKLFMAANHKPVVHGGDKGIWRRLKLIPFVVTIPEDKKDKDLDKKFQGEASGILNWIVEGCLNWQKEGLKEPEKVKTATEEYKEDMDILGEFLSSCCDVVLDGKVLNKHVFLIYQAWCNIQNCKPLSHIAFPTEMEERGFKKVKIDNQRAYDGLRLKNDIILEIAQTERASDKAIIDGLTVMTDFLRSFLNIFSHRSLLEKPLNRNIEVKNKAPDIVAVMQIILSTYDGSNRIPGNGWDIIIDRVMLEFDLNMAHATEYVSAARKKLLW